jgi:hypothetical protein
MVIERKDFTMLLNASQIQAQLPPFIDECARRGYPVTDVQIRKLTGVYNSFALDVTVDWMDEDEDEDGEMDKFAVIRLLRGILRETTPAEIHLIIHLITPHPFKESCSKMKGKTSRKKEKNN